MLNTSPIAIMATVVKAGDLKLLTHNSGPLQDLVLSARHRLQNITIVSFYETEPTPPLNVLVSGNSIIALIGCQFKSTILSSFRLAATVMHP